MLDWIELHIPAWVYITIIFHLAILGGVAYLILLERKVASWAQDRIGPNRVGLGFGIIPWLKDKKMMGFGQPLADGLKFIMKEDYQPKHVDRVLFTIAPGVMIIVIIISIAVLPWGGIKQGSKQILYAQGNEVLTDQQFEQRITDQLPAGAKPVRDHEGKIAAVLYAAEGYLRNDIVYVDGPAGVLPQRYLIAEVTYHWAFQIADLNIGVLFILATLSLAVYGIVIGGWASNNKYSFLGGLRATANMISYEVPLGLSVLAIVVMYGTLDLGTLVEKQAHYWHGIIPAWNVFSQPVAFMLFLICIHAEANRAPFDLAEAEQELVGGYHTEYSAMRFALFFLAEYAGMITTSAVCVALFFGGWHLPYLEWIPGVGPYLGAPLDPNHPAITESLVGCIFRAVVFLTKTTAIIFVFMWVRWSLPRFRFDQLMMLAWRGLIPISLTLLMVTAVVVYVMRGQPRPGVGMDEWIGGREALVYLGANVVLIVAAMLLSKIIPAAPATNKKTKVPGSRFMKTPLPGVPVIVPIPGAA